MRGDGRVFQRGEWLWISYCYSGKEHREAAKDKHGRNTNDPATAEKCLHARLKEVHAAEIGVRTFETPQARRITIAELCVALKADFELRGKASTQNLSHLKRVETDFGEYRASTLTVEKIDAYIAGRLSDKTGPDSELIAGDRPATINRTTQMLGQCYALAIRRGTLARAPYIRHLSESGNARQGFFGEKELATVISHLPEDLHDFVRFAASTGMRKGEIASLTWADVDGETLTLRGENSKNGEARVIPLVGELAQIIERRRNDRQVKENGTVRMAEFIFHRNGELVGDFRKAWATACRNAGVAGRLFHDLRRSAVRSMTKAGVPQAVAMKISGHKTASMFQRYSIVAEDDLRNALTQTEKYRAGEQARIVSIAAQK